MNTGAAVLRHRIRQKSLVVAPGVFDGISIRMALKVSWIASNSHVPNRLDEPRTALEVEYCY